MPVFTTTLITMKFINAATLALETDFAPACAEYGSMVDIIGVGTADTDLIAGSTTANVERTTRVPGLGYGAPTAALEKQAPPSDTSP